ncbi:MAG: arginine--tRNA ligase [Myxococcota bacterium]
METPLGTFKKALARSAADALGLGQDVVDLLERQIRQPEPDRGDLALPCFELAKRTQQTPPSAALQLQKALTGSPAYAKVEAAGPYLNVFLTTQALAEAVVPFARSEAVLRGDQGAGKTVVIDFSSPNIAKPLAFHHIRSTVIGAAIARLHQACGWKVVGINYLGDWGKQFGLLATGFQRYGDPKRRADAKHLVEVYVKANAEADVEGKKAKIGAPEAARKLIAQVEAATAEAASAADPKAKAAAEKKQKSLEKKLRAERGQEESADPRAGLEAWLTELETAKTKAEAELPGAEARDQEARLFFKKLEDKDPAALAEWKEFREASIAEFKRVYARMGIEFTSYEGESFYSDVLEQTVARVTEKPGTKVSDGALIADLEYKSGEPPVLLKTRDGTTLYVTRDIAAAMDRYQRFHFDRSLYVVAADQAFHFSQLFRTLGAMGLEWASKAAHVPFGRVHGMSTRRGAVIFLDEVLDEAVQKARVICEASEKIDREALDRTVEAIGVGSVVFGDLKNLRSSDYTFRWEDAVNFDGLTGPYVQFTHARASSILRRGGGVKEGAKLSLLTLPEERAVMMALARVRESVEEACEAYEPSILTRAILDLSQAVSSYFTAGNKEREKRILLEDQPELSAARLLLVDAVKNVLAKGLAILGVVAPEAM